MGRVRWVEGHVRGGEALEERRRGKGSPLDRAEGAGRVRGGSLLVLGVEGRAHSGEGHLRWAWLFRSNTGRASRRRGRYAGLNPQL